MDYHLSIQETCAASAAIRSLQSQLKEMRLENSKLQSDLRSSLLASTSERESFEKQCELLKEEFLSRESSMKEDLVMLCQRIKYLEHENLSLLEENHRFKEILQEGKQSQRMVVLLQDELSILHKKLQQKEVEQGLLDRRIKQLESQEVISAKQQKINASEGVRERGKAEDPIESQAQLIDSELSQQKMQYREYLKNPNPSSNEWKQRVDQLRVSIESNSQELLRLRREQYEHLKNYTGN